MLRGLMGAIFKLFSVAYCNPLKHSTINCVSSSSEKLIQDLILSAISYSRECDENSK